MSGFMRQRGSSWELRVYAGRDVVTGRKRWVSRTVKGGKREAQRALAAMVAKADRGALTHTTATVGELLEEWFALASPGFSPVRRVVGPLGAVIEAGDHPAEAWSVVTRHRAGR